MSYNIINVSRGPPDNILSTDPKPAAKKPKLGDKTPAEFEEFIHDDTDYYNSEAAKGFSKNKNVNPKPKLNVNKGQFSFNTNDTNEVRCNS